MSRSVRPQSETNNRVSRQFSSWATGDGVLLEFALPKNVRRLEDLIVTVQGLVQRPADNTSTHDYEVRGVRPSYPGDTNVVRFTTAPGVGFNVGFHINGD